MDYNQEGVAMFLAGGGGDHNNAMAARNLAAGGGDTDTMISDWSDRYCLFTRQPAVGFKGVIGIRTRTGDFIANITEKIAESIKDSKTFPNINRPRSPIAVALRDRDGNVFRMGGRTSPSAVYFVAFIRYNEGADTDFADGFALSFPYLATMLARHILQGGGVRPVYVTAMETVTAEMRVLNGSAPYWLLGPVFRQQLQNFPEAMVLFGIAPNIGADNANLGYQPLADGDLQMNRWPGWQTYDPLDGVSDDDSSDSSEDSSDSSEDDGGFDVPNGSYGRIMEQSFADHVNRLQLYTRN